MATIMIVDDSNYTRRTHRRIVESAGHVVHEASTGMAALESYFVNRPDLVLLDLTMEDMSGLLAATGTGLAGIVAVSLVLR